MTEEHKIRRTTALIVFINLSVALVHFVTGPHYKGPCPGFVNGYLLDILIPFAWYFLLYLAQRTVGFLKPWYVKSTLVFAIGAGVEIAQFFGMPIFGQTFDPLDFVMYGSGGILAAACDRILFPRIFKFWRPVNRS